MQSYPSLFRLAEEASGLGFPTLRLDYDGTGESFGSDEDAGRVEAWIGSVVGAMRTLRATPGIDGVALLGLRMGGLLAAAAAAREEAAALVFWEPCLGGAQYAREMEILASASLGALTGGDAEAEEADPDLEAGGFVITAATRAELAGLTLKELTLLGSPDVLLLTRGDRPPNRRLPPQLEEKGLSVDVDRLDGFKEMMVAPAKSVPPREMLDRITRWLSERGGPGAPGAVGEASRAGGAEQAGAAGSAPTLATEADHDGVTRRAERFGPEGRLFGVASASTAGPTAGRPGVLMLAGGVVPRTAVNRMYVTLADELVRLGHPVFRVDVSGVAEALAEPGRSRGDPYPPSLVDDVVEAVDWARSIWGTESFCLLGLCSGAYAAFQVAARDDRVAGALLINPLVFHWEEGLSLDAPSIHQFMAAGEQKGSLTRADSWRRLLSGEVDIAYAVGVRLARLRTASSTRWAQFLGKVTGRERGLAGDLQQILAKGTHLSLAYSEGDPGLETLRAQAGYALDRLRGDGMELSTFAGADHTFSERALRRALLDWAHANVERSSRD